jgi:Ca2+-binding EF-hand superfamily protein
MNQPFARLVPALILCSGTVASAEKQAGNASQPAPVGIVKIDAGKGTITVKMKGPQGTEVEKTFKLTKEVRMIDETGRAVAIDAFEAGEDAQVVEREGALAELRRPARARHGRPSDILHVLIEMSDCDEGCTQEVQRAYDILRRLDKNQDGKIDADELKAGRQSLVEGRVNGLMKRLDTNQDGKISRDEARGMIKRHFDQLDSNKDGFIDRDELLKAASERHERTQQSKERR